MVSSRKLLGVLVLSLSSFAHAGCLDGKMPRPNYEKFNDAFTGASLTRTPTSAAVSGFLRIDVRNYSQTMKQFADCGITVSKTADSIQTFHMVKLAKLIRASHYVDGLISIQFEQQLRQLR